jgi:hypothetical protein
MPFQKTFRILLEEDNTDGSILDSIGGASFLSLNGTDTSGAMNADSLVLGTDESQSESKPGWLSEDADGSGDYAKRRCVATNSGWVFTPGQPNSGNDNSGAQPEDTRTSNVTNNTLGLITSSTISLNSGGIDKMTGDRIILEDVIASYSDNDTEAGIVLENEFGHLLEEAGGGMPADLDLGIDQNASFTVS